MLIYNNDSLCSSNKLSLANHRTLSGTTQTSIVIVIPSCRKNFMQRNLIRQTYGSIRNVNNVHIVAVVFMLGGLDARHESKIDTSKLDAERAEFGDVIMGDFVDHYRNLSQKSIMAYDWLSTYCHGADLAVKTDDDVMVDIFKLTAELSKWSPDMFESFKFWCGVHGREKIDRNRKSIYYVSYREYAKKKLPKHCAGLGYVTPMVVVRRIADEISKSFRGRICSHEDVFMTGIVPEKINSVKSNRRIQLIDKKIDWIFYVDEHNPNKDGKYIWDVVDQSPTKAVDFDEFRKRSGTRIFYLLQHDTNFKRKFLRLWYLVKSSFRNDEDVTNKIDKIKNKIAIS